MYSEEIYTFIHTNVLLFQLAKGGIQREIYKKLIEPFKIDMPTSEVEGFRRVCTEHKYGYFGPEMLKPKISLSVPCKMIQLPGNSYRIQWAFVISKNSPHRGLINWR